VIGALFWLGVLANAANHTLFHKLGMWVWTLMMCLMWDASGVDLGKMLVFFSLISSFGCAGCCEREVGPNFFLAWPAPTSSQESSSGERFEELIVKGIVAVFAGVNRPTSIELVVDDASQQLKCHISSIHDLDPCVEFLFNSQITDPWMWQVYQCKGDSIFIRNRHETRSKIHV
jgi:hypothetical protein